MLSRCANKSHHIKFHCDVMNYPITDFSLFLIANVVNLLVTGVFLARARGYERIEYVLGLAVVALALLLITIVILNALHHRAC